jgi:hypothetical protein
LNGHENGHKNGHENGAAPFRSCNLLIARIALLALGLLLAGPALAGKILFIGNSFTFAHGSPAKDWRTDTVTDLNGEGSGGLPVLFKAFAAQAGLRYEVYLETHPGVNLDWHLAERGGLLASQPWDTVVMQGYSTLDADHPGRPALLLKSSQAMAALLRRQNPHVALHLLQTWARADQVYPSGGAWKSVEAMTTDLHQGYSQAAAAIPGMRSTAPVGDAWLRAMQSGLATRNPYQPRPAEQLDLWADDHYHASAYGTYLEALVVFGTVTGRDPRGLGADECAARALGLSGRQATSLQQIAFEQLVQGQRIEPWPERRGARRPDPCPRR